MSVNRDVSNKRKRATLAPTLDEDKKHDLWLDHAVDEAREELKEPNGVDKRATRGGVRRQESDESGSYARPPSTNIYEENASGRKKTGGMEGRAWREISGSAAWQGWALTDEKIGPTDVCEQLRIERVRKDGKTNGEKNEPGM